MRLLRVLVTFGSLLAMNGLVIRLTRGLTMSLAIGLMSGCNSAGGPQSSPASAAADRGGSANPLDDNGAPSLLVEPILEAGFQPNTTTKEGVGRIRFHNEIPDDEYTLIAKDLHALRTMTFDAPSSMDMRHTMKLSDSSSHSMVRWLEDRVRIILDKYYDRTCSVQLRDCLSADNYGAVRFSIEFQERRNFPFQPISTISIPGAGDVRLISPRVGLIRLGPRIFNDNLEDRKIEISRSIMRLGILFHEGRHGDGNWASRSLIFSHTICPGDHSMAGLAACDMSSNGPYTIAALFVKAAMDSCKNCSKFGKEQMKLNIADSLSRVLKGSREWDDIPERSR